jgi:hypothetical protein
MLTDIWFLPWLGAVRRRGLVEPAAEAGTATCPDRRVGDEKRVNCSGMLTFGRPRADP